MANGLASQVWVVPSRVPERALPPPSMPPPGNGAPSATMPTLLKASDRFTSTVAEGTPTVTVAAAVRDPPVAVTVSVPVPVAGAVYSPAGVTVPPAPPASTAQANAGWVARASPNWSFARAANASVPRSGTVTADGDTVTPAGRLGHRHGHAAGRRSAGCWGR